MNKLYVRIKILSSEYTPNKITEIVGLEADRVWNAGDLRPNTIIREPMHGWVLNSHAAENASLMEHVSELLAKLEPAAIKIKTLSEKCDIEFSCIIYDDSVPSLFFDKAIISQICALGAALDIDLYIDSPGAV